MKMETKNNLKIILIIVGLFGISIVLFLYRGYDEALYYSIIGIPLVFIAFAYQYIKRLKKSRPDPGLTLKTQENEKIAYDFKNLQSVAQNLNRTYGLQVDDIEGELKTLAYKDLPLIGINSIETNGTYATTLNEEYIQKIDLDKIDTIAKKIYNLDNRLKNNVNDLTNAVSKAYISYIYNLKNAGYNIGSNALTLQTEINKRRNETNDTLENVRYLDTITSIFKDILLSCSTEANQLKNKVKELGKNVSNIESEMNTVQETIESKNYKDFERGVTSLTKIMSSIESQAGGDFGSYRNILLSAIEKILTVVENKIENEYIQKLSSLGSRVRILESASKIGDLQQIEPQIIPLANEIAKNVFETININEARIKQANFPQLFYPTRQSFEKDYTDLQIEFNVGYYSEKFSNLMNIMIPILEKSDLKSKVIGIYTKISPRIQNAIENKGIITSVELKVKNPEEFMELYSYFHSDVTYNSYEKTLSSHNMLNQYKVSVIVFNEENIPLTGADIILKMDDKPVKKGKSDETGKVILDNLNKGNYKLLIKCDDHKTQIKKIELNSNQEFDIKLSKISLGEKLCKEDEELSLKKLAKIKDIILKEIESNKYIKSTYNFKVNPGDIPCLLYLWSKTNNNTRLTRSGNEYILYDVNKIKNDIEIFIKENVLSGEKTRISDLIDLINLPDPLPINEIISLIDELKKESDSYRNVEHDSDRIWKIAEK
jgi:hypothetical protein